MILKCLPAVMYLCLRISHVNLFVESVAGLQQFTNVKERSRVTSILKGKCDVMFMGHTHRRSIKKIGGVNYITVEDHRYKSIYCQVWVTKDEVRWEFKKL